MRAKIDKFTKNFEAKGTKVTSITPRQTTMLDSFKIDHKALENKRKSEIDMTKNLYKTAQAHKDPEIQPI